MSRLRAVAAGLVAATAVAACSGTGAPDGGGNEPSSLPVGDTAWDAVGPAWLFDGTLHVGDQSVEMPGKVDRFVVAATGVYWVRLQTLYLTDVEGATEEVGFVPWGNIAVSADRSVFAAVDQSRGPTDEHGTRMMQVAAFDTRTGEELYRTPDEQLDPDADHADLYGEVMPLLQGVSDDLLFFDSATIDLEDGSSTPSGEDAVGVEQYVGYAETLFPDGFHVVVRSEGGRRFVKESSAFGTPGRLSPDRSTLFDVATWPAPAVAYDAATGRRRTIEAPWRYFTLGGWIDDDTFWGAAERIQQQRLRTVVRAQQVVTCELPTLVCEAVSPVYRSDTGVTTGLRLEDSAIAGVDPEPP
jgi:hypothetical protein